MHIIIKKIVVLFVFLILIILSCKPAENNRSQDDKLKVTATIFPLYDFARVIGGERVAVSMLVPAETDAHNYDLNQSEIEKVINSDIFLFINFEMEHWAHKIISAAAEKTNMLAVETGKGTFLLPLSTPKQHTVFKKTDQHTSQFDPHIWLDFDNMQKIIDNISDAYVYRDPKNSDFYKRNANEYKLQLIAMEKKYREGLTKCKSRVIIHAGRWGFAYLAKRYKLKYMTVSVSTPERETFPQNDHSLLEHASAINTSYIFYDDFIAPRLAQIIAQETGADLIKLNNCYYISNDDIESGSTFLSLMEENLINLRKGLSCL